MGDDAVHLLSNSFLAVHLIALHELPDSAGLGVGPFLVVQRGIDPADPELTVDDYVLSRCGAWLPLGLFARLPRTVREATACFPAVAEVIALLQQLPSRPVVEHPSAAAVDAAAPAETAAGERLDAAIRHTLRAEFRDTPRARGEERPSVGFN